LTNSFNSSLPDSSDREELNELVNKLLSETNDDWTEKSFDFLIQQILLRSTLKEFVHENGLSTETVLEIECILRDVPQPQSELPHDDWVGAIRATEGCFIAGCYDNTIHVWSLDGERLAKIQAHTGAVKCLAMVPHSDSENIRRFASGSQDQTIALWEFDTSTNSVTCMQVGKGHERSVECICSNSDGTRLASGGFDGYLKIWNTADDDNGSLRATREQKKMKTESSRLVTKIPMVTLAGHRESIHGSCWTDTSEVITASFDRSIIIWDLELAGQKNTLTGAKAFTALAYSQLNRTLISGSTDRHVRLWDPRSKEGAMVKSTFSSHTGWVVGVDWSKTNEYAFISASYDNLLKMWDTRSPKAPLFDLTGHEDRLLCCDWSLPTYVLSGGVDNSVKVFRTNQSANESEM